MDKKKSGLFSTLLAVLVWGGLWGIFEATAGCLLHLLPFSAGWLVWYPAACFFMLLVYRATRRAEAVALVGLLAACVKLLNLFLPVRVDRVVNPSVSIVFEALAMAAVLWAAGRLLSGKKPGLRAKGLSVLCMNTGWRVLYALYLLLLAPGWMREISVISSAGAAAEFFLTHNFLTCLLLLGAAPLEKLVMRPVNALEGKISASLSSLSRRSAALVKIAAALCLLGGSAVLGLLT